MAGALALGEYLAGAVIALMLASGQALESYADRRAHRELSALLARAPQMVTRYEDGELVVRPIDEVRPGDRLLVKKGEVVPVDGVLPDRRGVRRVGAHRRIAAGRSGPRATRCARAR